MSYLELLKLAAPETIVVATALAVLTIGLVNTRAALLCPVVAAIGIVAAIVALLRLPSHADLFGGMLVVSPLNSLFKIICLVLALVTLPLAAAEKNPRNPGEFTALLLLGALGLMLLVGSEELLMIFIGLELLGLSLYVLAAFDKADIRSAEAGLKYFVLGALASGMLLYGASLVYGFAGTTSFAQLAGLFGGGARPSSGLIIGMVFVSVGLAFKVSAVPFHMWVPDVYEGAPTPVTAFFSVAPKMAAIALFVRFLIEPFGGLLAEWRQVIVFLSVASMILGAVAAIAQQNIKRLMAYSSIGHVGYALIGLAAATPSGIRGVLIYMAIYLFMNVGTWAVILCMRQKGQMLEGIADLSGLGRSQPGLALALAIFMFAMAGIPPTAGFFSKLYIFLAAIDAKLVGLAVIGVVTSVVGAFYYLRIVKVMYFDEPLGAFDRPIAVELKWVLVVTAVATMFFILFPDPVVGSAEAAAAALFAR